MPVTEDEVGNTSVGNLCSDGVGDPYLNYNVTDDGETQEISATVYQVSGKSEHTQYVNPVFQKENGEIYANANVPEFNLNEPFRLRRKHYGRYPFR